MPSLLRCRALPLFVLATSCVSVSPRFPQNVQASFARDQMRKLTTRSLDIYYPAALRGAALRIAARVERCMDRLRSTGQRREARERGLVYLTSADFNNAYVASDSSSVPQQMVMPHHTSLELFHFFNLGIGELGDVGCHEAVHYVQMQQEGGLWRFLNWITGGLFQPNIFTESWFLEGLATYYEGHLNPSGRPNSPVWRGWFEAAAAARRGDLNPGHLNGGHRDLEPFGGNYLTGSHFVAYLAKRYGEQKLWDLVQVQGDSIFSPLGVTLRFKSVYGRSIGALFDDFTRTLQARGAGRKRPGSQKVLAEDAGSFARLASSPKDGALALITVGRDEPARLTLRERDGQVRFSRRLTQILPERRWIGAGPILTSGLSFTGDGRWLYLVSVDVAVEGSSLSRLWKVDARDGKVVRIWDGLTGLGGGVTPDGGSYVFASVEGDTTNLVRMDLETGAREPLTRFTGRKSLGAPAVSPDGTRIVFAEWSGAGFDLALREADGAVRRLTHDGRFNYSPRWVDDARVIFLREEDGRAQVHLVEVATGERTRLTDVPHLAMDPAPLGDGSVAFLNREGVHFTVDSVELPGAPARMPPATATAAPPGGTRENDFAPQGDAALGAPPEEWRSLPGPARAGHEATPEELSLVSDEPYSTLEHFFRPELRAPFFYALGQRDEAGRTRTRYVGGLGLAGQDRLGMHAYGLLVSIDSSDRDPHVSLTYGNAQLAPWYLQASAARVVANDRRADLLFSASAQRSFWTTPVSLGVIALQRDEELGPMRAVFRRRLAGPRVGASYAATESTSYGGPQRGLLLSGSAALYPSGLSDLRDFADTRVALDTFLPGLPFLDRDNLQLSLRGRFLPGAPRDLLQLGGVGSLFLGWQTATPGGGDPRPPVTLPSGVAFTESLRGYEDYAVRARHAVIAGARYRERFIIDYGWASFLYLLPSFFLRQVELEAFGEWARTDWQVHHRAAGGAAHLHISLGGLPLGLSYQYARRFDDGLADLHLVGLSFE